MNSKIIDLEGLKQAQLSILIAVHDFCVNNGINYFLAHGTLIGAVRHKGFIPWDDDIEIAMPRQDYDRFISTFNGAYDYLKVLSYDTAKDYYYPIAKVYDNRTIMEENIVNTYPGMGINIDIFPIDGIPDDTVEATAYLKRLKRWEKLREIKQVKVSSSRSWGRNFVLLLLRILLLPFTNRFLLSKIDKIVRSVPFGSTNYAGSIAYFTVMFRPVSVASFQTTIDALFEGHLFKIPQGYDEWLRNIFGDYMQLPPEEKRVTHHVFKAYWK